jgi:hypothetical protein
MEKHPIRTRSSAIPSDDIEPALIILLLIEDRQARLNRG